MKLLSTILSSLQGNAPKRTTSNGIDMVILFAKSVIVRQDLIASPLALYERAPSLEREDSLSAYIQVYLKLEQFIIHNKPLVVQKSYTKESLREEIRRRFKVLELPEAFRILFLPQKEQLVALFEPYTQALVHYIFNQTGAARLQSITNTAIQGSGIGELKVSSDRIDFSGLRESLNTISTEEIIVFFKKLNTALFTEIASSFGPNVATDLTEKNYELVKKRYDDYDLISAYLKALPKNVLEKERLDYVTKDLEQQTKSAAGNEAKLLASITSLPLGFILADPNEKIVTVNSAVKSILGLPEAIKDVHDIDVATQQAFKFQDYIAQTKSSKSSLKLRDLHFGHYILYVTITPIFLAKQGSEYIGTVILVEDVTEVRLLDKTKDEFFAIASHELRTPLTVINGYASMLKSTYEDKMQDSEFGEMIDHIEQTAARMSDLINNFLCVSEIEQGKLSFNKERFSLNEVVVKVIHELGTLIESKRIMINVEGLDASLHEVYADPDKARQVTANILSNAVKFTPQGTITILLTEKDKFIFVKVTDTGKGIPVSSQHLLFRKFQQTEDFLMRDVNDSAGLGLYISKKLVEGMGGGIYLEKSAEKQGSTFTFYLPKA